MATIQENLANKRGYVSFSRYSLTNNPQEDVLKEIFSNFFPIAIENDHTCDLYYGLKMFGYSKHFREINELEPCPKYEMQLITDENGVHFNKMIELDPS